MTKLERELSTVLIIILDDLKLRASLTDTPYVLDVSHGILIKAERAISNFLDQALREDLK